uniref:Mannosylglycerate hydrolase MGH1-like glycoside hydrolase domain-containing protein n=1 Tax=Arion vulgaris TaxID=1028688 RepID=A0A0B7B421_9EUPU
MSAEQRRLKEDKVKSKRWKKWGPYLAERQWATVREDYSSDGNCWEYFPHDDARSRAYRWGEDGLLGISDNQCRLCLAMCVWNEKDPILKERLFGLTSNEGNHGEDVKELYYYLDSTPTHSYMSALYKYPHEAYPYDHIVAENKYRNKQQPEYELLDTGIFDDGNYWDVKAEFCKSRPEDILVKYIISNRGSKTARIHVLPTLWFRNMWSWGSNCDAYVEKKPCLWEAATGRVEVEHQTLGNYVFEVDMDQNGQKPDILFTENETNCKRIFRRNNPTPYVKDAFHRFILFGEKRAVNPEKRGTKCAPHYVLEIAGGEEFVIKVRLFEKSQGPEPEHMFSKEGFDDVFAHRKQEADEFYEEVIVCQTPQQTLVTRQAYAGLLWSKQFYHYIVLEWLQGDLRQPYHSPSHSKARNSDWRHLFNRDIISMPDKWEYPWYASWDLAFHMLPFASIDLEFCKKQTLLFLREWYMHPNGQIPAYEFAFGDVNPPVHAYAVLKIYKASGDSPARRDQVFLARCFQKLALNFTWWVNRKDPDGLNIFEGGFLGLDNIGVFDRSKPLPTGGKLAQADGTAWMAFFCELMVEFSLILAHRDQIYEDMASKFFEHFVYIMDAINFGVGHLWDEEDGFYYDSIIFEDRKQPLKIRSMVGMVPLFSSLVLWDSETKQHPGFYKRMQWFMNRRKGLACKTQILRRARSPHNGEEEEEQAIMLSLVTRDQLTRILKYLLDEEEFLSPYGIRSISKYHDEHPFTFTVGDSTYTVRYDPGESNSNMFGGNSNWRGPIWLPMNYMIIENLERYDTFFGESLKVECPTGSGNLMRLGEVARELSDRLVKLFLPGADGHRPCHGGDERYATDPHWKDLVLFYEYFHGETGRGCGASHQTGWSALVVNFLRYVNHHPMIVDHASAMINVQP